MARPRLLLLTATLLAFTLLAGGCSTGSAKKDTTQKRPVPPQITREELIAGFASAGIGTYVSPTSPEPMQAVTGSGPLKILEWQASNLAREASAGGGYAGARLDALAPLPKESPPLSFLIAAYVQSGPTRGAELSRRIMGEQDWRQAPALVFPNSVLMLFASDAAAPAGASQLTPIAATRLLDTPSGICSALATWVSEVIAGLFDALKVDTSGGGVGGFLGSIWNTAIDLLQGAVQGLAAALTAPILAVIKTALAVIGTLSMAASLLHPAAVSVTANPDPNSFGIDPAAGNDGSFTTTVKTGATDWPADLLDCAQQAGVTLPNPQSINGSPIQWTTTGFPQLGLETGHDNTVDDNGRAGLNFRTNTESQDDADQGAVIQGTVTADVSVSRNDVKDLQNLLATLLFATIPGPAGPIVNAVLAQLTQPVFDALTALVAAVGSGAVTVIHHGPAPKQGQPGTTACVGSGTGVVPDGTWTGPIGFDVTGQPSSASGSIQSTGGGTLTMTVQQGKVVDGTWSASFDSTGSIDVAGGSGRIQWLHVDISGGTVSGSASAPDLIATSSLDGSIAVAAGGVNVAVPISQAGPATATMTVQEVTCAQVTATFIPSFNASTGGAASFSGVATWTGSAA